MSSNINYEVSKSQLIINGNLFGFLFCFRLVTVGRKGFKTVCVLHIEMRMDANTPHCYAIYMISYTKRHRYEKALLRFHPPKL